jgi:hypothetical protein
LAWRVHKRIPASATQPGLREGPAGAGAEATLSASAVPPTTGEEAPGRTPPRSDQHDTSERPVPRNGAPARVFFPLVFDSRLNVGVRATTGPPGTPAMSRVCRAPGRTNTPGLRPPTRPPVRPRPIHDADEHASGPYSPFGNRLVVANGRKEQDGPGRRRPRPRGHVRGNPIGYRAVR